MGKPVLQRRDANAAVPVKGGLMEVIGEHPFRAKAKRCEASTPGEPARSGKTLSPSVVLGRMGDGMDAKSVVFTQ
jgi:hypothetical protein